MKYTARVRFGASTDCVTTFPTATEAINDCLRMTDKDGNLRPFLVTCDGVTVSEWRCGLELITYSGEV